MRTVRTKVYKFNELTDEAKQKALEHCAYFNVEDSFWYESIKDDAKEIGLQIEEFDIDRASYCKGDFLLSANEVAQNILNNHGEECETYKTAESFMKDWQPVYNDYLDEGSKGYESAENEQKLLELESDFKESLLSDYLTILRKEYEYQTSEAAIKETIEANGYEFTKDGKMF